MQSNPIDNVWLIYTQVIDETIRASAHLQSAAVLDKIKQRWIAHLTERVARQCPEASENNNSLPILAQNNHINDENGASRIAKRPMGRMIKVKATADEQDRPVRTAPSSSVLSNVSTGVSRFQQTILHEPTVMKSLMWDVKQEQPGVTPSESLPLSSSVKPHRDASPKIHSESRDSYPEDGEPCVGDDQDEDDWGEWEDSSAVKTVIEIKGAGSEVPLENQPSSVKIIDKKIKEGYTDDQGRYIPSQADFSTRIVTQYGRTNLSDAATTTVLDGEEQSTSGPKQLLQDLDAVDSDLDNVEDLSDEEFEARDIIVAQYEAVNRPGMKKIHSQGIWRVKARNGVANIGGQEFFFESLYANLDFQN